MMDVVLQVTLQLTFNPGAAADVFNVISPK